MIRMCGVIGAISFIGADVIPFILNTSVLLQNRGRDSLGFATGTTQSHNVPCRIWKKPGSATEWLDKPEKMLHVSSKLSCDGEQTDVGIGHVRYATASRRDESNAQPHKFDHGGNMLIVASNGDIPFYDQERQSLLDLGYSFESECDAEVIVKRLGHMMWVEGKSEEEAFMEIGRTLSAAFSLVVITPSRRLFIIRDPKGFHPLWWAQTEEGVWVCSESALLEEIGTPQEVLPGTLITVSSDGSVNTHIFAEADPHFCLMDVFYLCRPDSRHKDRIFRMFRQLFGEKLAEKWKELGYPQPDIVTPIPYSGNPAANGFAIGLGCPLIEVILKDRFAIGRVFQGEEENRTEQIRRAFTVDPSYVKDLFVVDPDDTNMRGDQSRVVNAKLRRAGAEKVGNCYTAPPCRGPCFYGLNIPNPKRLIAYGRTQEEVRIFQDADYLLYLDLNEIFEVLGSCDYCTGCFDGNYPIPIPEWKEEV